MSAVLAFDVPAQVVLSGAMRGLAIGVMACGVILIYREDAYNRDPNHPDAGTAELILAKQRNGPTGIVRLAFLREQTRFANLAASA